MSRKRIRIKIKESESKQYYEKFLKQIKKGYSNFKPKNIVENDLLEILIAHSKLKSSWIHLDWATGRGGLLRYILKNTKLSHIVTIDLDIQECAVLKRYLEKTNKINRVSVVCADTRQMPFCKNSFDSITTLWGLDEQRESCKAVKESIRILKNAKCLALSGGLEDRSFEELEYETDRKLRKWKSLFDKNRIKKIGSKKIEYYFNYKNKKYPVISYIISGRKSQP